MDSTAAERTRCRFCSATFSHRSSLMRHLRRNCNQPRPQSIRRKSCSRCAADKVRCNLKRPSCSRCSTRQIICQYPTSSPDSSDSPPPEREDSASVLQTQTVDSSGMFEGLIPDLNPWDILDTTAFLSPPRDSAALVPSDNAHVYLPDLMNEIPSSLSLPRSTESPAAALANHSMQLIFRVLRSWPRMLAEGFQTPPFMHHSHIADTKSLPQPLATCFTLVKMWHGQCKGAEDMVHQLVIKEVNNLLTKPTDLDEPSLLTTLQTVLIYLIIILFPGETTQPTLPPTPLLLKVQDLGTLAANTGLFLQEEREALRPSWSTWIHITSKRRAVLSLYLLRWALSVFHAAPLLDCGEVGFMPAPAAKALWQAQSEKEWDSLYIRWLARWDGHGYLQGEFDRIRPGIGMEERAEKWLEEADEFGLIMMSIVNATDYPPPAFAVQ